MLEVFRARVRPEKLADVVAAFEEGSVVHTGDDVAVGRVRRARSTTSPGLRAAARRPRRGRDPGRACASAVEFVLEGLHLSKRLNKDAVGGRATYRGRG